MESLEEPVDMENLPTEAEQDIEENDIIGNGTIMINLIKVHKISPEMLKMDEVTEWKCFICDVQLTSTNSVSVFYTILDKSQVPLIKILNRTLKTDFLAPHSMRSPMICDICSNLFDELELAERHCLSLRNVLITGYRKTCEMYNQVIDDELTVGVACQTNSPCKSIHMMDVTQKPSHAIDTEEKSINSKIRKSTRKSKTNKKDLEPMVEFQVIKAEPTEVNEDRESEDTHEDNREEPPSIDLKDEDMMNSDAMSDNEDSRKRKQNKRKKHRCPKCPRLFRRPGELKNHLLVSHVGSNPNQCVYCQKKFNSRNGLYVHLKKIHQVEYADRKQMLSSLGVDSELAESEPLASYLNNTDEAKTAGESSEEEGSEEENGSDGDWTEETGTQKKSPTKARTRAARLSGHAQRRRRRGGKEKENLGASGNASSGAGQSPEEAEAKSGGGKGARRRRKTSGCDEEEGGNRLSGGEQERRAGGGEECLSRDEIKEEEEGQDEGEERGYDEEEGEEESGGSEGSGGGGEGEKKKRRTSRVGERACMPLIHACPTCGKKWRTVSELNAHIQTHSDLRPFVCEICGQGYKMRKALDVHVGMHNGIHPFTCHFCNKSFTQKVGLQKHLPIHTGYSRYQCDLCGKRFIHQKSFAIHKMVHSGEKNIKCSICNLALLSSSHLKRHFRVHTGERPYECSVCYKRFAEKYNLNAHQKIHLPPGSVEKEGASGSSRKRNSRQKCQVCGFTSSRQCSLQDHWEREHKELLHGDQYEHNALSSPSSERLHQVSTGIIPQMIIDPSGSITYEEKPRFAEQLIYQPPETTGLSIMP